MMMRRYQDAIRTFSNILLYIQRTKSMFQNKAQLYDQVGHGGIDSLPLSYLAI